MGVIFKNGVYYSGPPGRGISSFTSNPDGTITISLTDGTEWTSDSLRGPRGNGITSVTVNGQGAFVFTFEDGSTYTSDPINGLPDVSENDIGKVLRVGDEGTWEASTYNPLPAVTDQDSGKILQVDPEGDWSAVDYNPLPSVTSDDEGKNLYVNEDGDIGFAYTDSSVWTKYTDEDSGSSSSEGSVKLIYTALPDVSASDAGKFLMVDDDGNWSISVLADGRGVHF